nr:MAG TPA: hypothetical protein [Caudoviricetes sp.]
MKFSRVTCTGIHYRLHRIFCILALSRFAGDCLILRQFICGMQHY